MSAERNTGARGGVMAGVLSRRCIQLVTALAGTLVAVQPAQAATSFPNDPFFAAGGQWALTGAAASINAPPAWCLTTGGGITVAVVDTGADLGHPDLAGKLAAGAQYLGGTAAYPGAPTAGPGNAAAVTDDVGHGTMVSGIIAADTGNGQGVAAVAPDARILVVKVLQNDGQGNGTGYDSDVANGIRWATDHGAGVINVSIGPTVALSEGVAAPGTSNIPNALHYAASHDVAVAISAGNGSLPLSSYPTVASDALVVGAVGPDGSSASYSNSGAAIYAPGGTATTSGDQSTQLHQNIVSTALGGGYATGAGTSFASPMVAGTLALLRARGYSGASARQRITDTAVSRSGLPQLDAAAAVGATGTCGAAPAVATTPPPVAAQPARGAAPSRRPAASAAPTSAPGRPATSPSASAAPATPTPPGSPASPDVAVVVPSSIPSAVAPEVLPVAGSATSPSPGRGRGIVVAAALGGGAAIALAAGVVIPRWRRRP